jgi:P4 family phage/plasmid primase-like protien
LTQKRGASSGTNSELVKAKGKRFMLLQEPSENERINVGLMKELTGGDKVQARGLFKEPIEFKPQFKLVLTCNDLPAVPPEDGGTWRRVRVLPFTSKFVEKPNPKCIDEHKIDFELSEKLELWKEAFMAILINYYSDYIKTGIVEPYEVMESTDKYRRENDCYAEFVLNRIEYDPKKTATVSDIYEEFKFWWKEFMPSNKLPSMTDFRKRFERQFGEIIRGKWRGISLIPADKVLKIKADSEANNDEEVDEVSTI